MWMDTYSLDKNKIFKVRYLLMLTLNFYRVWLNKTIVLAYTLYAYTGNTYVYAQNTYSVHMHGPTDCTLDHIKLKYCF